LFHTPHLGRVSSCGETALWRALSFWPDAAFLPLGTGHEAATFRRRRRAPGFVPGIEGAVPAHRLNHRIKPFNGGIGPADRNIIGRQGRA